MESLVFNQMFEDGEGMAWFEQFFELGYDFDESSAEFPAEYGDGFQYFNFLPMYWPYIYNFPMQTDDVLIATFPKCGTTWMQQIVYLIMTQNFDAKETISQRFPFIEFPSPNKQSTLMDLAKKPTPRLMKTHLPFELLPKHWRNGKLIYVYRNAKDCAVSFYHHTRRTSFGMYQRDFDYFAREFINGKGQSFKSGIVPINIFFFNCSSHMWPLLSSFAWLP